MAGAPQLPLQPALLRHLWGGLCLEAASLLGQNKQGMAKGALSQRCQAGTTVPLLEKGQRTHNLCCSACSKL